MAAQATCPKCGACFTSWCEQCKARGAQAGYAPEPTVDTEAAEVWRGLSESERKVLVDWDEGEDSDWARMMSLGLHRVSPGEESTGAREHTDLGKRVAAYGASQTGTPGPERLRRRFRMEGGR